MSRENGYNQKASVSDGEALLRSLLEDETLPEGYNAVIADRNAELIRQVESTDPNDWEIALKRLLEDLNITVFSEEVDTNSFSAREDTYVADCYRLAQVAWKLQKRAEGESPPRYNQIVFLTRMRKRAQHFSKKYSKEPEALQHPGLEINAHNDSRVSDHIRNARARIAWIRAQVGPKRTNEEGQKTSPHTLRLELAKTSLEQMGDVLEEIAREWAKTSGKPPEECIEYCFSYFTNEVLTRFPETGWINIPHSTEKYPNYEAEKMYKFVEVKDGHLRDRLGKRAKRILKNSKAAPENVHTAINQLIEENKESLEM